MSPTSILLGVALAIVVLPFILEPFVRRAGATHRRQPALAAASDSAASAKDAALIALRDLDFDFQTGKVTAADYAPLRQQLLLAAAKAAQREQPTRQRANGQPDADAAIEAAVKSMRRGRPPAAPGRTCSVCGRPATPADKFCGGCGAALDHACPNCAAPVQFSDRFCAGCGAPTTVVVGTAK